MKRSTAIKVCVGVALCLVAGALLWLYCGAGYAAVAVTPLALAAAAKRVPVRLEVVPVYDDVKTDTHRNAQGDKVAETAKAEAGGGWDEKPSRDRPKLNLIVFCCLLPSLGGARAQPLRTPIIEAPRCVPVDTYGGHATAAGYGLWMEDGKAQWCPCLPAGAFGETARLAQGCTAPVPVIGYTLEAHASTAADLAKANVLIPALRVDLTQARKDRDKWLGTAALRQDALTALTKREGVLMVQLAVAERDASAWFTWRSVILSGLVGAASAGTVYGVCHWKDC